MRRDQMRRMRRVLIKRIQTEVLRNEHEVEDVEDDGLSNMTGALRH